MISRRSIALALTLAMLSGPAWSASGNAVKMFDTDNDGTLDLAANVAREVEEETGLAPADYQASPHWDCVVTGASIALMRVLDAAETGEILKRRIEANLAAQDEPELSAIRLVRSRADLTAAMPHFVTAFLNTQFSEPERSA